MLDLFLSPDDPADARRRSILESLFNGDWQRLDEVQYYDHGQVRGGRIGILRAMYIHGVRALLPRVLRVLQRSNWTGTSMAMNDMGIPAVIHGLLPAAYLASCETSKKKDGGDDGVIVAESEPAAAAPGAGDDYEDWGGADDAAGAARQAEVQLPTVDEDQHSLWRLEQDSHIESSRRWAESGTMADDLIMGKTLYAPMDSMMLEQLRVTGSSWEAKQQRRMEQTGKRSYRMLLAHDGLNTATFMQSLHGLLFDTRKWHHLNQKSGKTRSLIFRVVARAGATAYQLLETRHRSWPYRLFSLLKRDDIAGELARLAEEHPCLLDAYTKNFADEYDGRLTGPDAKAELELVARFADTDTASTERVHSENQRRGKHKVWTHPPDLASSSAWYMTRTVYRGKPWRKRVERGSRQVGGRTGQPGGDRRRRSGAAPKARQRAAPKVRIHKTIFLKAMCFA